MKLFGKTLGLLLVSLVLASCGGGGGDGGAYSAPESGSITLTADRTTLPLNSGNVLPFPGSPFMATVNVTFRSANGTIEAPGGDGEATFTISNANIASLSYPDDPETDDINEFQLRLVSFHQILNNGSGSVFINSYDVAGTTTLTVSAIDPQTNVTVSKTLNVTVAAGVGNLPASITLSPSTTAVYVPSSNGGSTSSISAYVVDGANQPVPNPATGNSGVDNVQFELVGDVGGSILSTSSASGAASGTTVTTHTVNGVAVASFQAADSTPQGPIQIRATVDRADNNVSNGITDPVSTTTSVIVSDGKLYSLEITSPVYAPNLPGITINSVSGSVSADSDTSIPPDPDATLTLVVTALATDRQGNPVIPGTPVRFGLVDEPVGAPGTADDNLFLMSGYDGNPKEGGMLFTATHGDFTTGGVNGANAGDALLVFGRAVEGNADLESAVTVTSVNSATSLNVTPSFNYNYRNDVPIDTGAVLPYLIGRAMHGNITATGNTDDTGIVHASMTYTVNTVGNSVAIWAQGDGVDTNTNGVRRVTAAGTLVYPGVAPATISASPDPIIGDTTSYVTVCAVDALGIPLRGLEVSFQFELATGTGSVDGQSSAGTFADLTDLSGCSTGMVVTSGLSASTADSDSGTLHLAAAGQTTSVGISVQVATLQVSPNSVFVPAAGITRSIVVTARAASGDVVPGAVITGSCTASGGESASITLSPDSATTGTAGTANFTAAADGFVAAGDPPTVGTGQCTFTTDGSNSATVTFNGNATCDDYSPPDPNCGSTG